MQRVTGCGGGGRAAGGRGRRLRKRGAREDDWHLRSKALSAAHLQDKFPAAVPAAAAQHRLPLG